MVLAPYSGLYRGQKSPPEEVLNDPLFVQLLTWPCTSWLVREWKQLVMVMFTACVDASGQEKEHPYMVVAGFISSADEWIKFSEAWNEKLMEYGLDHFGASDCQNYQGQFATWKGNDAKRIALWCDLLTTIKGVTFQKFGCGIEVSDWAS